MDDITDFSSSKIQRKTPHEGSELVVGQKAGTRFVVLVKELFEHNPFHI